MKRFLQLAIFTILYAVICSSFAYGEDVPVFSMYSDGVSANEEFQPEEGIVFDTEEDYSKYEDSAINFAYNAKDYEQNAETKVFMLHTTKDKMLDNIQKSKSLYYSVGAYDDSDYRNEIGMSASVTTKKVDVLTGFSQRSFDGNNALENRVFVAPELKLTKNLSLKTKLTHSIDANTEQSQLGLNYKCSKSKNDLQFELRSGYTYKERIINSQSVQFITKFKI